MKEIILYHRQNGLLSRHYIGQFWRLSLIMFQHSTAHMIIDWHVHIGALSVIFTSELQLSYWFT